MGQTVRLCGVGEAPKTGEVTEMEVNGVQLCVANVDGELHALDNLCPHAQGPLGQGWIEGEAVVCPWHAWAFDVATGIAAEPEQGRVQVYPVRREGEALVVDLL